MVYFFRMELSEQQLIAQAAAGKVAAFEKLLYAYEKRIFYHVARFINRREDAEDVTQEVFIKVYRNLKAFKPETGKFTTWIYTIATRTAYDWLRHQRRSPAELFVIDDPEAPFETFEDDAAYNKIAEKEDWALILKNLKPEYQTVVALRFQDELSYEEIANVLGLPIGTVRTYLHRAKADLAKFYESRSK